MVAGLERAALRQQRRQLPVVAESKSRRGSARRCGGPGGGCCQQVYEVAERVIQRPKGMCLALTDHSEVLIAPSPSPWPVTVNYRQLLASAGDDGAVRIWDPQTREQHAVMKGEEDAAYSKVNGVCSIRVRDQQLLASAGGDGAVRIWDLQTGEQHAIFDRPQNWS